MLNHGPELLPPQPKVSRDRDMDIDRTFIAVEDHTATCTNPRLPPELIFEILAYLYYNEEEQIDRQGLATYALVHTEWAAVAQELLYSDVTLSGHVAYLRMKDFHASIDPSTDRGKCLGGYVRSLDLPVGNGEAAYDPVNFVSLLRCCPNLYNVSIHITDVHEFTPSVARELAQLSHISGPLIRSLRLRRAGIQSPILYQLLTAWPSVQFLLLINEVAATPPPEPAPVSLYELVLQRNLSPDIWKWLLSSSSDSLRILDIRDLPGSRFSKHIILQHGHRIRSLRFLHFNNYAEYMIQHCTNLQEVVLYTLPSPNYRFKFPSTLEHLSFRNPPWVRCPSLQHILDAIPKLPRLRTVTGDMEGVYNHVDAPALMHLCAERGLTLSFDGRVPWQLEDPIITDQFPRGRSIRNMWRMRN